MAALNAGLPNTFYEWPNNAVLTLIRRRRVYQGQFATTSLRNQVIPKKAVLFIIRRSYISNQCNFCFQI
jgi:hypothetical protein